MVTAATPIMSTRIWLDLMISPFKPRASRLLFRHRFSPQVPDWFSRRGPGGFSFRFSQEFQKIAASWETIPVWSKYRSDVAAPREGRVIYDGPSAMRDRFQWARLLAFVTGL